MAPAALIPDSSCLDRDGLALESLSDQIDQVNLLEHQLRQDNTDRKQCSNETILGESQFDVQKDKTDFRRYEDAQASVKAFYQEQHEKQTVAYNLKARHDFHNKTRAQMTVWQAMEKLNTLIDESDPDTSLSQIEHLLQTAEALRRDGKSRWLQLTGLIHDLGKLLYFYGAEGQWDVVGDTFPVGCAFDERIVLSQTTFDANPDRHHPIYSSRDGIYSPGCGLDQLMLSWGHDEYLYHVVREQSTLPVEALAIIRYHSFYPWHSAGAYREFMNEHDEQMLEVVKAFNPYDLYSKSDDAPRVEELKPYYLELIDEFFPCPVIRW